MHWSLSCLRISYPALQAMDLNLETKKATPQTTKQPTYSQTTQTQTYETGALGHQDSAINKEVPFSFWGIASLA